jgi:predicted secreted hydrolase
MRYRIMVIIFLVGLTGFLILSNRASDETPAPAALTSIRIPSENFRKADQVIPFSFPLDHGPHPDFQTEWWYYTGNLKTNDGRPFGYQLTFFRRSLSGQPDERASAWGTNQVYMAHFSLTDPLSNNFTFFEKLERGVPELAGAQGLPFYQVWLHDWQVKQTGADAFHLQASQDDFAIDLDLVDLKGPVFQGDRGLSQKGGEPGNASYYYSQTRLKTRGVIRIAEKEFTVTGFSWMDHEFSTSALGAGVIGWDWFSMQLDDESEIMLFTLRKNDGSLDELSSGMIINADGSTRHLINSDFGIQSQGTWQSPATRTLYPSDWLVTVPSENLRLTVSPAIKNQEVPGFFTYWEGSVVIEGTKKGNPVSGSGYTELTGYAASMQGQF